MAKKLIDFKELESAIQDYADKNCVPEGKKDGNFSRAVRELIFKGVAKYKYDEGLDWISVEHKLPEYWGEYDTIPKPHDGLDRDLDVYFDPTKKIFYFESDDGYETYRNEFEVTSWREI